MWDRLFCFKTAADFCRHTKCLKGGKYAEAVWKKKKNKTKKNYKTSFSRTQTKAEITVPILNLCGLFLLCAGQEEEEKKGEAAGLQHRYVSSLATPHSVSRRPAALTTAAALEAAGCVANVKPPTRWAFHLTYEHLRLWPRSLQPQPLKCRDYGEKERKKKDENFPSLYRNRPQNNRFSAASSSCAHRSSRYLGSSECCNHSDRVGSASKY